MAQNVTSEIKVRSRDVGVRILVWGWDEFQWNLHLPLLEKIEAMAVNGYAFGQPEEDIEDDLLCRYAELFANIEVEIMAETDELEVRLEPIDTLESAV